MLQVQVKNGVQVVGTFSVQQFLKADQAPCALFVEEAINRFNTTKANANEPERAVLVRYH
jgi:hypothetical protein